MYYPNSENKGTDQLHSYCEADLRLCFRLCRLLVSHAVAHLLFQTEKVIFMAILSAQFMFYFPLNSCLFV